MKYMFVLERFPVSLFFSVQHQISGGVVIDLFSLELFISSNKTSGSNGQTNHELNFLG